MSAERIVDWEQVGPRTLLVTLQRPPANALGLPLIEGLAAAMDHAESVAGLRVVVVASRIPGIFAAGADIKHMVSADQVDVPRPTAQPSARRSSGSPPAGS